MNGKRRIPAVPKQHGAFDPKSFWIFAILTILYSDFFYENTVSTAFFKQAVLWMLFGSLKKTIRPALEISQKIIGCLS